MSKIGITLNEVLRDYISQFSYTYEKYNNLGTDEEGEPIKFDLETYPIKDYDLMNHELVNFEDKERMNKFLYVEAALELSGHADQTYPNIMTHFNHFLMDIIDDGEHEVELVSREVMASIPSTFFFLSKTLCKANNIRFVTSHEDKWNGIDILITACPIALENKPSGKISVKVNSTYNTNIKSDFQIDNLFEFMDNFELREQIFGTKSVEYREIKE
jgi:hypothetical protein